MNKSITCAARSYMLLWPGLIASLPLRQKCVTAKSEAQSTQACRSACSSPSSTSKRCQHQVTLTMPGQVGQTHKAFLSVVTTNHHLNKLFSRSHHRLARNTLHSSGISHLLSSSQLVLHLLRRSYTLLGNSRRTLLRLIPVRLQPGRG